MKTRWLPILTSLTLAIFAAQPVSGAEWKTDFEAAKAEAKKDNKVILLDFTGSDWCGWCIKMKKDILTMKAFTDYAAKNVVLMEVDFPERKRQPAPLKKANEALQKQYDVEGYPTFVITDAAGKELGRHVGYMQGGPAAFIDFIGKLKTKAAK